MKPVFYDKYKDNQINKLKYSVSQHASVIKKMEAGNEEGESWNKSIAIFNSSEKTCNGENRLLGKGRSKEIC